MTPGHLFNIKELYNNSMVVIYTRKSFAKNARGVTLLVILEVA